MSQQPFSSADMYQDYLPTRSPTRPYNNATVGRQPSRPFDSYGPPQPGLYTAEDHARQEYDNRHRFDLNRTVSASMHPYGYDTATWNYSAQNAGGATLTGATARMKPPRRAGLPTVREMLSSLPALPCSTACCGLYFHLLDKIDHAAC